MNALIIVDVQKDFLPGGALGVEGGDEIIPVIERLVAENQSPESPLMVVVTADRHPERTAHFDKWPVHCVADTPGAEIDDRIWNLAGYIVVKGEGTEDDGYSGFEGEDPADGEPLDAELKRAGITDVTVVGLALDYCVKATALDAQRLGYDTAVILAGTRAVAPDSGFAAIEELRAAGVKLVEGCPVCGNPDNRGCCEFGAL